MIKKANAFTIVELLIVIVVIAILAAISVVAYRGIQDRAYDSTVQSDLSTMAKKIRAFQALNDRMPQGSTDLTNADIPVTRSAYSRGSATGGSWYNVLYCWANSTNPSVFALVAQSKSGNVFHYTGGTVSKASYTFSGGSVDLCASAGINISASGRDFFYSADAWQSFAK